jgi:hypothetical protein
MSLELLPDYTMIAISQSLRHARSSTTSTPMPRNIDWAAMNAHNGAPHRGYSFWGHRSTIHTFEE